MTAATCVVILEPSGWVEEQQPAKFSKLGIDWAPQSQNECRFNLAGEISLAQRRAELAVQPALLTVAVTPSWSDAKQERYREQNVPFHIEPSVLDSSKQLGCTSAPESNTI